MLVVAGRRNSIPLGKNSAAERSRRLASTVGMDCGGSALIWMPVSSLRALIGTEIENPSAVVTMPPLSRLSRCPFEYITLERHVCTHDRQTSRLLRVGKLHQILRYRCDGVQPQFHFTSEAAIAGDHAQPRYSANILRVHDRDRSLIG